MREILGGVLLLLVATSGCTTKANAKAKAQAAFVAGQQQAISNLQPRPPSVSVNGEVRNRVVLWTDDLTVAKAIVAAEYYGFPNPRSILIIRNGQTYYVNPKQLLKGEADPPLEPGDVIELRR